MTFFLSPAWELFHESVHPPDQAGVQDVQPQLRRHGQEGGAGHPCLFNLVSNLRVCGDDQEHEQGGHGGSEAEHGCQGCEWREI